jgi:flagellar hook assembly protein FlgD
MDITVYNIRGQKVRTLFEGDVPRAGNQTIAWDGKNSFGSYVSSGLYLITIQQSGNPMISEKVLFVK